MTTGANIVRIGNIVDDACEAARTDLIFRRAEISARGAGYSIVLKVAGPTATELSQAVHVRLVAAGFVNVEVSTEW